MAYTLGLEFNVRTRTAMSLYRNVPEPFRHAYHRLLHLVRLQENNWSWRVRDKYQPRRRILWQIELCGCGSTRRSLFQSFKPSGCLSSLEVAFLRFDRQVLVLKCQAANG